MTLPSQDFFNLYFHTLAGKVRSTQLFGGQRCSEKGRGTETWGQVLEFECVGEEKTPRPSGFFQLL